MLPGLRQRALARLPPGAARPHPRPAAARSGPGASGCTPSPAGSTPTATCALARATYAEMALAGITCVGEFHYLHHAPGGGRYADPNAMGEALIEAAADAGIRLTLLDTCYLAGGLDGTAHLPLDDVQRGSPTATPTPGPPGSPRCPSGRGLRIGAAVHSVRAVPAEQLPTVAARPHGAARCTSTSPSSRPRTRPAWRLRPHPDRAARRPRACSARTPPPCTPPTSPTTTSPPWAAAARRSAPAPPPSATSPTASARSAGCRDAGSPALPGQRQHAVIDLLEEARLLELDERLATGERGHFRPGRAASTPLTADGHRALGWPDAGRHRAGRAGRPGRRPAGQPAHRRLRTRPGRCMAAARRRRAHRGRRRARSWSPTGSTCSGDVGRLLADGDRTAVGGAHEHARHRIGELVTNDPAPGDGPLGLVTDAALVVEDGARRLGRARRGRAGRRRARSTPAAGR